MPHKEPFRDALVPLTLAVVLVHERVYGKELVRNIEEKFDGIAAVIAALVPIYQYGVKPDYLPSALSAADLAGGVFRRGGKEFRFSDGRSPKVSIAVRLADIEDVVSHLLQEPQ